MMKDANARLLITTKELRDIVDEYVGEVIDIEDEKKQCTSPVNCQDITPDSLFILLYTSGSTGIPRWIRRCRQKNGLWADWAYCW